MEKAKAPEDLVKKILALVAQDAPNYFIEPLDTKVALAVREVDRGLVPDMPDRVIAATAKATGLPLITRDQRIRQVPGITCIW